MNLLEKILMLGKKNGVTEDEMERQHQQVSGHEFEQALEDSAGWRSLVC